MPGSCSSLASLRILIQAKERNSTHLIVSRQDSHAKNIMFLFDFLFGRHEKLPDEQTTGKSGQAFHETGSEAPGTAINYDAHLVQQLHEEHRGLLQTFQTMVNASKAGQLDQAQVQLEQFRMGIMNHLLKENVRLYIYLEHLLEKDEIAHDLMHSFRREMNAIGKTLVAFLGKYKDIGTHPELAHHFAQDLVQIGAALSTRIQREEETLYPLYRPPSRYD